MPPLASFFYIKTRPSPFELWAYRAGFKQAGRGKKERERAEKEDHRYYNPGRSQGFRSPHSLI